MSIPKGYEKPATGSDGGKYLSLKEEKEYRLRVISPFQMGYIYWAMINGEKKPVRSIQAFEETPCIDANNRMKHIWLALVWNYELGRVQIWEIPQATIQEALYNLETDGDWGDTMAYDIKINRKGKELNTEYTVTPSPNKVDVTAEIQEMIHSSDVGAADIDELWSTGQELYNQALVSCN